MSDITYIYKPALYMFLTTQDRTIPTRCVSIKIKSVHDMYRFNDNFRIRHPSLPVLAIKAQGKLSDIVTLHASVTISLEQ